MTGQHPVEVAALFYRADQSVAAALELASGGFHDFAASRAYYAAFYAGRGALLDEDLEFTRHSGVVTAVHQRYVKRGKLQIEHGKALNWLFELRGVADYGGTAHVSRTQALEAI